MNKYKDSAIDQIHDGVNALKAIEDLIICIAPGGDLNGLNPNSFAHLLGLVRERLEQGSEEMETARRPVRPVAGIGG